MVEKVIFAIVSFIVGLIFIEIGIYAFVIPRPMHFWSGSKVKLKDSSQMKKYNRLNGFLWIFIGIPFLLFAALCFTFGLKGTGPALLFYTVFAVFTLIFLRHKIEKKYCMIDG